MYKPNQKIYYFLLAGILIMLVVACSGSMNMKEDKQKYTDKLDQVSVQKGKVLYQNHCQQCHGESGKADGPIAKELTTKPANLMESGLHFTSYGMRSIIDFPHYSPESIKLRMKYGNDSMPAYKNKFTKQEQKDITNYILELVHH